MSRDLYHITEFYLTGTTQPFTRRHGIMTHPRVGEDVDVRGVSGRVVAVNWNLDYADRPHEQWRCNVYIDACDHARGPAAKTPPE